MVSEPLTSAAEWISASQSLELLYPHHGGWLGTKFLLAELLKDGKLQARAEKLWTSDAPSLNAAWKGRANAVVEVEVEVSRSVWNSSRYWLEDVTSWRWPDNRFVLTRTKKPADRTFIEGVKLRRTQVAELLPAKNRKDVGGKNIRATDWEKIGVALVMMAQNGTFGTVQQSGEGAKRYKNKTEFIDKILVATGGVYNRTHAFAILGPIYAHFHPEIDPSSLRIDEIDSF